MNKFAPMLYKSYLDKQYFSLPDTTSLTESEAYAVQCDYALKRSGTAGLAGYKAGLTNQAAQANFGVNKPLAACLYKQGVLKNGAVLSAKDYPTLALEAEVVFFADKEIPGKVANVGQLRKYFSQAAPGIELVVSHFDPGTKPTANELICANVNAAQVIVGERVSLGSLDLNKLPVTVSRDGELLSEGQGRDALGCQWQCLLWLVNKTLENGHAIRPGDIFFTGALGKVLPGKVPGNYQSKFGELGQLNFQVF